MKAYNINTKHMNNDCIFCKIVKGEVPSKKIDESEGFCVFEDIHPKAPVHLLIIPTKHVSDLVEVDSVLFDGVKNISKALSEKYGLKGFRLLVNSGEAASVKHLHFHFLGGVSVDRQI